MLVDLVQDQYQVVWQVLVLVMVEVFPVSSMDLIY